MVINVLPIDILILGTSPGGEGRISNIITFAETSGPEKLRDEQAWASHVEMIASAGPLAVGNPGEIKTIGLSWPKAALRSISEFNGAWCRIVRPKPRGDYNAEQLLRKAMQAVREGEEKPYGWFTIVCHGLDYLLNRFVWNLSLRKWWPDWRPFSSLPWVAKEVCSSFIAILYYEFYGRSFGRNPKSVQPDDIDKDTRSLAWETVFEGVLRV